jgi:hypothetical protein
MFTHQLLYLINIIAALELSRFAICLRVVCAFVCFSGKKMPGAANSRSQSSMPRQRCCYCGAEPIPPRKHRNATQHDLNDAAAWRVRQGKQPVSTAQHVCATHQRRPPQSHELQQVRTRVLKDSSAALRTLHAGADVALLCAVSILVLSVCRRVQKQQQHLRVAH